MGIAALLNEIDIVTAYTGSYVVNWFALCGCRAIFIILLLFDVWKALKRRTLWIPGQALVLTALTIQLLTFSDNWDSKSLKEFDTDIDTDTPDVETQVYIKNVIEHLLDSQLVIDSRRVMICVLVACLLPGMARWGSGIRTVSSNIGALAFSVIVHMAHELYFFADLNMATKNSLSPSPSPTDPYIIDQVDSEVNDKWKQESPKTTWFIASYIALLIAITLLVVLLICAVIAAKSIRKIMLQKVPLALSCCCNSLQCTNIEDHVLKCWIVVRASQPDYIMSRSVFSAFAGFILTFCVVSLLVKWKYVPLHSAPFTEITIYVSQLAFVVVGSIVVLLRWLTAVFYFPRNFRCFFYFEDFWTRSLLDLKDDLTGNFTKKLVLSLLLTITLWLQKLMVLLSKACWYLPQIVFRMIGLSVKNKLMVLLSKACWYLPQIVFRMIGLSVKNKPSDQFSKYKEALEIIRMPGETAYSLWRANEYAFTKTENHMRKGENGEGEYAKLIHLLRLKTGPAEDEVSPSSFEEERHFKQVGKKSWKMRAVSVIHLMVYYCRGTNCDVVNDCIEGCSEAWDIMNIVDRSDPEAELVSLAADKEFRTLQSIWKKYRKMHSSEVLKPLKDRIDQLSTEEDRNPCNDKLQDSQDWKTVAAKISLQKTRAAIVPHVNEANAIDHLKRLLANLIDDCIQNELEKAVRQNCNKWAEEGKEEEIFKAAFIAGKARRVWNQTRQCQDTVPGEGVQIRADNIV